MPHPDEQLHRAFLLYFCLVLGVDPNGSMTPDIDRHARSDRDFDATVEAFSQELEQNILNRRRQTAG